jgi:hypothetical protein
MTLVLFINATTTEPYKLPADGSSFGLPHIKTSDSIMPFTTDNLSIRTSTSFLYTLFTIIYDSE